MTCFLVAGFGVVALGVSAGVVVAVVVVVVVSGVAGVGVSSLAVALAQRGLAVGAGGLAVVAVVSSLKNFAVVAKCSL